jgi:hypothetical protein
MLDHTWRHTGRDNRFLELADSRDSIVDTRRSPNGRYLWQFRKVASYADTIEQAKDYVEAGAEFFDVMRRNPYA